MMSQMMSTISATSNVNCNDAVVMAFIVSLMVGLVSGVTLVAIRIKHRLQVLRTYETIASLLSGMNQRQIDWVAAQTMVTNLREGNAVVVAFKALLLHPGVFQSALVYKNEHESILAWARAEELGLSLEAAAGNAFALWLEGMLIGLIHQDVDAAIHRFQLAANAGFALAQNSLGVLYQEIGQLAIAVEYYRLAAAQGVADAQYNLALLRHPDFVQMRPRLEEAAAQGHAEARFHLALVLQRLHDAAAVRFAHGLINNANQENFVHQGDQHIPERGIENEVIQHFQNVRRPRHVHILQDFVRALLVRRPVVQAGRRLAAAQGVVDAQFNLAMLPHPYFEQMCRNGEDDVVNGRPQRGFRKVRYSHARCDLDMKPARSMTCPSGSWHTVLKKVLNEYQNRWQRRPTL
jgi:tetratricopeptide (TPR) repeat protein